MRESPVKRQTSPSGWYLVTHAHESPVKPGPARDPPAAVVPLRSTLHYGHRPWPEAPHCPPRLQAYSLSGGEYVWERYGIQCISVESGPGPAFQGTSHVNARVPA